MRTAGSQRCRRTRAGHANRATDVDLLAGEGFDNSVGNFVIGVAQCADIAALRAEPRYGDRGISGLAAAGDEEFGSLNLGAGGGKLVHPHDDVLYRATGAENFRGRITQS